MGLTATVEGLLASRSMLTGDSTGEQRGARTPPDAPCPRSLGLTAMKRSVLLYDDDCGFCRWSVSKVLAWDRAHRIRAVALQTTEASELLGDMEASARMQSWHLVGPDGRVRSGGDAVAPLLRLLPGGGAAAPVVAAFPNTTRRAYSWTASHRDRLGRIVGARACSVRPTQSSGGATGA